MTDQDTTSPNGNPTPDVELEANAEAVAANNDASASIPAEPVETEDDPIAVARADAQKYLEALQRERADFANYKKRVERERVEAYQNATREVMKSVLPIIDDFERAVGNIPEDQRETPFVEGTIAIDRKFKRLLEQFDIEVLDPVGEMFDPDQHQALGIDEDAEVESGHVSQTLQKGYRTGEKVLRPALVRVAG